MHLRQRNAEREWYKKASADHILVADPVSALAKSDAFLAPPSHVLDD